MSYKDTTLVFAEFFDKNAVDTEHYLRYFPQAAVNLMTTVPEPPAELRDRPLFKTENPRFGWRMNDYWKVRGLTEANTAYAISFDADTRIVSDDAGSLRALVEKFGLCLPANPRKLVRVDTLVGADSDKRLDETRGTGYAMNMTPIAVDLRNRGAVAVLTAYLREMENNPVRGPLAMWRAAWRVGFAPYILPPQWCVCARDCGVGDEIILHTGHPEVAKHYAKRLQPEPANA